MEYSGKKRYRDYHAAEYDSLRFTSFRDRLVSERELSNVTELVFKYYGKAAGLLDIPCGTGRVLHHLLRQGMSVTGVDISQDMINIAKVSAEKFENFQGAFIGDAENLDFLDDSFDGVTCVRLFGHIPDEVKPKILNELLRVSKNGVIISFPKKNWIITFKRFFDFRFKAKWYELGKENWYDMTLSSFSRLLDKHSMEIVERIETFPIVSSSTVLYIKRK